MLFISIRRYSFIFLIPAFILILSALLKLAAEPLWQYCDPCYVYLLSALNMVKGIEPCYTDHPGTPLQILILCIFWLSNLGHSAQNILNGVLTHPEVYLSLAHQVLIFLSFITSILLAVYIYQKTQDKIAVLLTQLPGLSFLVLPSFTSPQTIIPVVANVFPETLLIGIMNLFNLSFLMLFYAKTPRQEILATLFMAFILGLGIATKLTILPLLIPALIVLPWRLKPLCIIFSCLSFILWTLPIIHKYPLLWGWAKAIVTHTGFDGRGNQGIVNWHDFLLHFFGDIMGTYWFYLIPVIGIFIYTSKQFIQGLFDRTACFLWAAGLGVLLQTFIVAKHFASHYLVPSISLCGIIFSLFYIHKIAQNKNWRQVITVLIFIFVLLSAAQAMIYRSRLITTTRNLIGFHDSIYSKYPNCTIIASTSRAISLYLNQDYALFFANNNNGHVESEDLSRVYPHHFYFNAEGFDSSIYGYGIWDSQKRIFADDILASSPCVILLSGPDFSNSSYQTRLIEKSPYADAYLVVNSVEKQAVTSFSLATEYFNKGNYPQAFLLALNSKKLNFQPEGEVDYLIAMIYGHLRQK